jgi:hypothetical protein
MFRGAEEEKGKEEGEKMAQKEELSYPGPDECSLARVLMDEFVDSR